MSGYISYALIGAPTTVSPYQETSVDSEKYKQPLPLDRYHMLQNSGNPSANQLQQTVNDIQDFFCQLVGAEDRGKMPSFFINLEGKIDSPQPECFKFHNQYVQYPEAACHEFTHAVMKNLREAPLGNKGQLGAINEAIADIIGVMYKQKSSDQYNDWKVNGTHRNLSQSFTKTNVNCDFTPKYDPKTEKGNDNGHVHYNSQLLSHAFYLACKNCEKFNSSKTKILSIWFNAARYLKIKGEKDYFFEFARKTIKLASQDTDARKFSRLIRESWEQVGFDDFS